MKIKEIALEQMPRERLKNYNTDSLSDAELLAILLQNGSHGENVIDLGNRLISTFGIDKLNSLSLQELMKIKGIGLAKASKLIVAFELSKGVNSGKICEKVVKNPSDIANYYIEKLKDFKKEYFIAVFLDSKNKIIKDEVISIGTLNSSLVHPREVFKPAVLANAAAIIVAHNHPSGDCTPSGEDIAMTKRLKEASEIMGIPLLDHLVVSGDGCYYSFAEHGQI